MAAPPSYRVMEHKVIVVGTGGVGKSAITIQLIHQFFESQYDPTIEDSYRKQVEVDNKLCVLDILDTAGQDDYHAVRDKCMSSGEGFLLVYSIENKASFGEAQCLHTLIQRAKDSKTVPCVLVANKCDLEAERQITTEDGAQFAREIEVPFFEVSAKIRINIDEAFAELVRQMRTARPAEAEKKGNTTPRKKAGCALL